MPQDAVRVKVKRIHARLPLPQWPGIAGEMRTLRSLVEKQIGGRIGYRTPLQRGRLKITGKPWRRLLQRANGGIQHLHQFAFATHIQGQGRRCRRGRTVRRRIDLLAAKHIAIARRQIAICDTGCPHRASQQEGGAVLDAQHMQQRGRQIDLGGGRADRGRQRLLADDDQGQSPIFHRFAEQFAHLRVREDMVVCGDHQHGVLEHAALTQALDPGADELIGAMRGLQELRVGTRIGDTLGIAETRQVHAQRQQTQIEGLPAGMQPFPFAFGLRQQVHITQTPVLLIHRKALRLPVSQAIQLAVAMRLQKRALASKSHLRAAQPDVLVARALQHVAKTSHARKDLVSRRHAVAVMLEWQQGAALAVGDAFDGDEGAGVQVGG